MEIKESLPLQKKEYPKFLEKSEQFYFETLSKNEKLNFIISFALIEDKNIIQKIIVSVKPYAKKNKHNSNIDKENYIEEIKRALSRVSYREKFSIQDFKDISDIYFNDKNLSMKKIFDDIVKSTKEKKARIKINKYHMVFNYYINNDYTDLNNSIMLCLDNEIESSILEKYYENTFRKLFKAKYNENNDTNTAVADNNKNNKNNINENKEQNTKKKMEISENDIDNNDRKDKTDYVPTHSNNNNNNNNAVNENIQQENIINDENQIHISPFIEIDDYYEKIDKDKDKDKYKIITKKEEEKKEIIQNNITTNNDSKKDTKDENKNINEKPVEKKKIFNLIVDNHHNNFQNDKLNESKISSNSKKDKSKSRSSKDQDKEKNDNTLGQNQEKNNNKAEQAKETTSKDMDTLTKNFLYNEYKTSKDNNINAFTENNDKDNKKETEKDKEEEKKMIEDSEDEESWGESLFLDKDEKLNEMNNKEKGEKNNLLGNKKSRTKSPNMKRSGKKTVIKISKLDIEKKEEKEKKFQQIIVLNEEEEFSNKKNKTITKKIINNENNINININESSKNKKALNTNINTNISLYEKIISPTKNPLYQKNIAILQRYMSDLSSIINSPLEIFILKEKIEPYNKIFFKLVYSSQKYKDDYDTFKNAVIDNNRHLILIKTDKNIRFAFYLNEKLFSSKGKQGQDVIDMMSFIYSFEKKTFFVPNERIVCFTQSPFKPYLFKLADHSIYIKNYYKTEKHYLLKGSNVFKINNLYSELNKGEQAFNISILEVYRAEIPD